MGALTRGERKLRAEIEEIASTVEMDVWNIGDEQLYPRRYRTDSLRWMKDQLVRGNVIIKYTLIDELLTDIICNYYFGKIDKSKSYAQHWKKKPFRIFVHYIMDEFFLQKKLAVVQQIMSVPKKVSSATMRINHVRNDLAHSLFPENRRRYKGKKNVTYKDVDLFSRDGIQMFDQDYNLVRRYFWKKVFNEIAL